MELADRSTPEDELDRRGSVLAHASALLGLIMPFGQLLGPYLTGLLLPSRATRARAQASEALNFQLQMVVLLLLLVAALTWLRAGWWFFGLFVPNLYAFGMALWAATEADRGRAFRYPFAFRVLRSVRVAASAPGPRV